MVVEAVKKETVVSRVYSRICFAALFAGMTGITGATDGTYSAHEKAFYAADAAVAFVRPGLAIKVNSAQPASVTWVRSRMVGNNAR